MDKESVKIGSVTINNLLTGYINKNFDFSNVHIHISTPCYGGNVHLTFMRSMMELAEHSKTLGIKFTFDFIGTESLITRARNTHVTNFLHNTDATHLLFVDSDIGFNILSLLRMISYDNDVTAQCYPLKNYDWEKILHHAKQEGMTPEILKLRAVNHVVNLLSEQKQANIKNGFVQCDYAGTGFLLIKRHVIEKMIEKYPDSYINDVIGYPNGREYYTLFDTMIYNKRYLSEDFAFCRKWRDIGGTVWADLYSNLSHSGFHCFEGNLMESMKGMFEIEKVKETKHVENQVDITNLIQ